MLKAYIFINIFGLFISMLDCMRWIYGLVVVLIFSSVLQLYTVLRSIKKLANWIDR